MGRKRGGKTEEAEGADSWVEGADGGDEGGEEFEFDPSAALRVKEEFDPSAALRVKDEEEGQGLLCWTFFQKKQGVLGGATRGLQEFGTV